MTLRLVDWADEEGARFGRSLLGSSSAAGTMNPNQVRGLKDRDGIPLPEALAACGVNIDTAHEARAQLANVAAYLELHIEQGPVLEQLGIPLGAVLGTYGVERFAVRFAGKANHAGSTPMNMRRDAFLAAARFALEARQTARELGGVSTTGVVNVEPGVVTIIPGVCTVSLDQRHLDAKGLAEMHAEARAAADRIAENEGCTASWEPLFQIEPIPFNPTLVTFARESCLEVCGKVHALPSGPLHDAAEMARLVPTAMLFVTSLGGLTHNKDEDTPVDHLLMAVRAHALLAARTIDWVASGPTRRRLSDGICPPACTLRLFLAVQLPDEVRTQLDHAVTPLTGDGRDVRWVAADLWHLTLVFLGERPSTQVPAILDAARAVTSIDTFTLQLGGTGSFPSPARPRVLWVGAVTGGDQLLVLQRTLQASLVAAGLAEPDTRFSAHLTVGRLRDNVPPPRLAAIGARWSAQPLPALSPFAVRSIALMRSVLERGGPRYTALHTIPLAAGA